MKIKPLQIAKKANIVNKYMTNICYFVARQAKHRYKQLKSKNQQQQHMHNTQEIQRSAATCKILHDKRKIINKWRFVVKCYAKFANSCRNLSNKVHENYLYCSELQDQRSQSRSQSKESSLQNYYPQSLTPISPKEINEQIPMNSNDFGFQASLFLHNDSSMFLPENCNINGENQQQIYHLKEKAFKKLAQKINKI